MLRIVITDAAHELLKAHALGSMRPGWPARLDGGLGWEIEVDVEVLQRLAAIDADPSKAIAILCATGVGNA